MNCNLGEKCGKFEHGFTLIEILIVIAIIGIIASVVLVSMSITQTKTRVVEFKSAAASITPACMMECEKSVPGSLTPPPSVNWSGSCGCAGSGAAFSFSISPTDSSVTNCTATISNEGTKFVGAGCGA